MHCPSPRRAGRPAVLTVKKILAGRGAVDYYLNQTRRGLADYYLPDEPGRRRPTGRRGCRRRGRRGGAAAPRRWSWPVRWSGPSSCRCTPRRCGRAAATSAASSGCPRRRRGQGRRAARGIRDHRPVRAVDGQARDPPPRRARLGGGVGLHVLPAQERVAAVGRRRPGRPAAGVGRAPGRGRRRAGYLEEHAAYVRAGRNGVRVLDTSGLVVARMNEWTSRDGDMHLHTHCLVLNRAQTARGRQVAGAGRPGAAVRPHRRGRALQPHAGGRADPPARGRLAGPARRAARARRGGRRADRGVLLPPPCDHRRGRAAGGRLPGQVRGRRAARGAVGDGPDRLGQDPPTKRDLDPGEALEQWEATARRHGRSSPDSPSRCSAGHPAGPRADEDRDAGAAARTAGGQRPGDVHPPRPAARRPRRPATRRTSPQPSCRQQAEQLVARVVATRSWSG
jgi:hypothetical protein